MGSAGDAAAGAGAESPQPERSRPASATAKCGSGTHLPTLPYPPEGLFPLPLPPPDSMGACS